MRIARRGRERAAWKGNADKVRALPRRSLFRRPARRRERGVAGLRERAATLPAGETGPPQGGARSASWQCAGLGGITNGGDLHQRHPGARRHRYRCSLPGLAGFTTIRRGGTDAAHRRVRPERAGAPAAGQPQRRTGAKPNRFCPNFETAQGSTMAKVPSG